MTKKFQMTNPKSQENDKLQIPDFCFIGVWNLLGAWKLEFVNCLEFGIWHLEF